MKKALILLFPLLAVLVTGCIKQAGDGPAEDFSYTEVEPEQSQEIANPASVHCEEQGGVLRMEENDDGTAGYCVFRGVGECEEWAYFRGECDPRDNPIATTTEEDIETVATSTEEADEDKEIIYLLLG